MPKTKLTSAFKAPRKAKEQDTRSEKDEAHVPILTGRRNRCPLYNYNLNLHLSPNARSFVLAYRIMKLIITEQGNNAWLAHGTPHLNVRSDFLNTETGIKRKQAYEACNMY